MKWAIATLGEVAKIERKGIDASDIVPGTEFLGLEHIQIGGEIIGSQRLEYGDISSTKFRFTQAHVLYGKLRPYLAKIALPDFEGICSTDILPIAPGPNLDRKYLAYYLRQPSMVDLANSRSTGANLPRLSPKVLETFKIPLPPIEEQRRIAAILDKADGVRRKRKEAIRLTEELLKSTFLEMFGDPVTNPKGWEICELQNVCNRVTDGTHQPPNWADEGIPFIFVSNIVNGEIDFKVSKHITEESWFELTSRCPIEINDILYTTVGSYGNAALVRTKNRFCFQRHIAHIKPDSRSIEPEFLLGMMQSDWIRQQADKQARGVAQKTLNLRELKKFTIFTPPIEEQKKYVKLRQGVEKQLSYYRSALEQSENLFNSLLQRAFRGEL